MRPNLLIIILGIIASAAALFWFNSVQSRREAQTSYAAQLDRKRNLEGEIETAEKRLAIAVEPPTAKTSPATTPTPTPDSAAQQQAARRRLIGNVVFGTKELATNPNLQRLDLERHRARIALEYSEFFESSRLTPNQIEQFAATVLKGAELKMDLDAIGRTQDAAGKRAMAALQQQTDAEHEAELQGVLGPQTYRELQEYERTRSVRTFLVNSFAGTAALAGVPLTPDQGDRLLQAALESAKDRPETGGPDPRSIDLARLDAQARLILTPAQFEVFVQGNSARKQIERTAVMAKVREAEEAQRK